MSASVDPKDWDALMKLLGEADSSLAKRNTDRIDKSLALFAKATNKLGLKDLEDLAAKFSAFFKQSVISKWDEEAVATMSFSLGALVEKMQRHSYGEAFSSGLTEIHEFLEVFDEAPIGETPGILDEPEVATIPEPPPDPVEHEAEPGPSSKESEADLTESAPSVVSAAIPQDTGQIPTTIQPPVEISREKPAANLQESLDMSPAASTRPTVSPVSLADTSALPTPAPSPLQAVSHEAHGIPVGEFFSGMRTEETVHERAGDSKEFLLHMLARDPASHVFVDLAEALCHEKRWDEAVEVCRKGLHLHPRVTRARVLLGWSLMQLGKLMESSAVLEEAREELEQNALLYRLLAEMAASRGDADDAAQMESLYIALSSRGRAVLASSVERGDTPPCEPRLNQQRAGTVVPFHYPGQRHADLLRALLKRFEGKHSKSASRPDIFPDEVRTALKRMIRGQG